MTPPFAVSFDTRIPWELLVPASLEFAPFDPVVAREKALLDLHQTLI